jgi:hypothetical protein
MIHQGGDPSPQRHCIEVGYANFMTPLSVETWCMEVCDGAWHLDADERTIHLSFAEDTDITLFFLSRYHRLIRR